ncbi:hypothetical protein [Sulfurimonas hydrogeniphila]|uniref:hypothetical protein n=1 Tax=Sulfurimonas hydrogeniphila TaxID=2509341 RepID=UPI00125F6EB2|nr:hypothetical protein [Sulfurimonas hydrogeniphila]
MKQKTYELFKNESLDTIVNEIEKELKTRNESPFWSDKVAPFSRAILSVLIPLRDNDLLFTPEGEYIETLTPEIFLRWSDFLSLKTLAFTLAHSNEANKLVRTKLEEEKCEQYTPIDLSELGTYLSRYTVNLENESLDFPIANYNLHQGVSNVIKSLL